MIRQEDKTTTLFLKENGPYIQIYKDGLVRVVAIHSFPTKQEAIEFFDSMSAELRK